MSPAIDYLFFAVRTREAMDFENAATKMIPSDNAAAKLRVCAAFPKNDSELPLNTDSIV